MIDIMLLLSTERDGSRIPGVKPYSHDLDGSIGYALTE
jgi:hypothetical protein